MWLHQALGLLSVPKEQHAKDKCIQGVLDGDHTADMYLQIWGKSNHGLIDMLYLVQQAVKAWLHSGVASVLPRQVCDQRRQIGAAQLIGCTSQPVMHPQAKLKHT